MWIQYKFKRGSIDVTVSLCKASRREHVSRHTCQTLLNDWIYNNEIRKMYSTKFKLNGAIALLFCQNTFRKGTQVTEPGARIENKFRVLPGVPAFDWQHNYIAPQHIVNRYMSLCNRSIGLILSNVVPHTLQKITHRVSEHFYSFLYTKYIYLHNFTNLLQSI